MVTHCKGLSRCSHGIPSSANCTSRGKMIKFNGKIILQIPAKLQIKLDAIRYRATKSSIMLIPSLSLVAIMFVIYDEKLNYVTMGLTMLSIL